METFINNIGVIKNSLIKIDGLTVITGDNNSGKSTIGKAISSIVNSTINLREKRFFEVRTYTISIVRDTIRMMNLDYYFHVLRLPKSKNESFKFVLLLRALQEDYSFIFETSDDDSLKNVLLELVDELRNINFINLLNDFGINRKKIVPEDFDLRKNRAIQMLTNQIKNLYDDKSLTKYANNAIAIGLANTFYNQIQPVKNPNCTSKFKMTEDGKTLYDLDIENNRIVKGNFYKNPFVFNHYISDCNIIDKIERYYNRGNIDDFRLMYRFSMNYEESDDSLEVSLIKSLVKRNNALEMQQYAKEYSKFIDEINSVFPEKVVFNNGKYICKENKLDVKNLATGSKLFAIFKMLLENGMINNETLIVLDEPENHLHPQWQLILAKIITFMVKEIGTKFIVTTHSPSFLTALNAYSVDFGLEQKSNYYYTKRLEDNYSIQLENVNGEKMHEAYYHLNKPFIDINDFFDSIEE